FGRKRYSNAASNNNLLLFELVWRTDSFDEPFRQFLDSPVDGFLADHDKHGKFIATEPGGQIDFANGCLDAPRHLFEEDVACLVTIRIVDGLETVEIELEYCKLGAQSSQPGEALLHFFSKQVPVRQIR